MIIATKTTPIMSPIVFVSVSVSTVKWSMLKLLWTLKYCLIPSVTKDWVDEGPVIIKKS